MSRHALDIVTDHNALTAAWNTDHSRVLSSQSRLSTSPLSAATFAEVLTPRLDLLL